MFFPEAKHVEVYTGTAAGSIRSCGCLYGCPSGTVKYTPSALARFILYPTQYVCFALLLFQLSFSFNNYQSSSFSSFFPPVSAHLWRTLPSSVILSTFYPHPSTSLVSHSTIPPPVYAPSFSLTTWVRRGRRQPGKLNASTMTGLGSECRAVSNHLFFCDWCLEQSGDNRTHLAKSHICHTDK